MRYVEKYNDTTYSWEPAPRYIDLDPETANELDKMIDAFEEDPQHALYRSLDSGDYRVYELTHLIQHDPFNHYYEDSKPSTEEIAELEYLYADLRDFGPRTERDAFYYLAGRAPNLPISEAASLIKEVLA